MNSLTILHKMTITSQGSTSNWCPPLNLLGSEVNQLSHMSFQPLQLWKQIPSRSPRADAMVPNWNVDLQLLLLELGSLACCLQIGKVWWNVCTSEKKTPKSWSSSPPESGESPKIEGPQLILCPECSGKPCDSTHPGRKGATFEWWECPCLQELASLCWGSFPTPHAGACSTNVFRNLRRSHTVVEKHNGPSILQAQTNWSLSVRCLPFCGSGLCIVLPKNGVPSSPRPGQKHTQLGPPVLGSSSLEASRSVVDAETQAPRESAGRHESMTRMGKSAENAKMNTMCENFEKSSLLILQEMEQIIVLPQNGGVTKSFEVTPKSWFMSSLGHPKLRKCFQQRGSA